MKHVVARAGLEGGKGPLSNAAFKAVRGEGPGHDRDEAVEGGEGKPEFHEVRSFNQSQRAREADCGGCKYRLRHNNDHVA